MDYLPRLQAGEGNLWWIYVKCNYRSATAALSRLHVKKSPQITLVPTWNPSGAHKKQQLLRPPQLLPLITSPFFIFPHMLNVLEPYILCSDYIITMIKQLLKSTALPQHSPQSEEMTDISLMSRFWLFEKTPILNYKHLYFSGYTGTQANVFLLSQLSWVNRLKRPVSKVKNKTFCCFHILSSESLFHQNRCNSNPCNMLRDGLPFHNCLLHQAICAKWNSKSSAQQDGELEKCICHDVKELGLLQS